MVGVIGYFSTSIFYLGINSHISLSEDFLNLWEQHIALIENGTLKMMRYIQRLYASPYLFQNYPPVSHFRTIDLYNLSTTVNHDYTLIVTIQQLRLRNPLIFADDISKVVVFE